MAPMNFGKSIIFFLWIDFAMTLAMTLISWYFDFVILELAKSSEI